MTILKHPSILTDLGHVGELGLPVNGEAWFQKELELCREWGFKLKIADGRARLEYDDDVIISYWIQKETPEIAWGGLRVNSFLRLDSTNREAFDQSSAGAPEGTLIFAETQTAGKGRKDRVWFSPAGVGVYFSLILRPSRPKSFWPLLTHTAASALAETLKSFIAAGDWPLKPEVDLKWPNDVFLSGKKCAGILLETMFAGEKNSAAIIGVGINAHPGSVPEDLASVAACVDEMAGCFVPRRRLLVRFLQYFQRSYRIFEEGKFTEILERWRSLSSMWNGAAVTVFEEGRQFDAVTCGLDEIGALRVRLEDGSVETVLAGDVRVRRR